MTAKKVEAYSVAAGHPNWLVDCPFCNRVHKHGAGPGVRYSHCDRVASVRLSVRQGQRSDGVDQYDLVYAGLAPASMIADAFGTNWLKIIRATVESAERARAELRAR